MNVNELLVLDVYFLDFEGNVIEFNDDIELNFSGFNSNLINIGIVDMGENQFELIGLLEKVKDNQTFLQN